MKNNKLLEIEAKTDLDISKNLFLGGILPLITINLDDTTFIFHLLLSVVIMGFAVSIKKKALQKLTSIYTQTQ